MLFWGQICTWARCSVATRELLPPPSSVSQRRWSVSPTRRPLCQTSPGCLAAAGVGRHTKPAQRHRGTPVTHHAPLTALPQTQANQQIHQRSSWHNSSKVVSHSSCRLTWSAWGGPCWSPASRPLQWKENRRRRNLIGKKDRNINGNTFEL